MGDETHLKRLIRVGPDGGDVRGADNRAIQLAVQALPPEGGTVEILPGTYTCLDAVHLKSNVRLTGHGDETVLRKCDGVRGLLQIDADYGQLKITPEDASGFLPGMGLLVGDNTAGGWLETATTILDVRDGVLYVADYLVMDYAVARDGWVSNACSLISGVDVQNVHVENITLDGNKTANDEMNGCRGGAIYLYKARRCTIRGCTVRDYAGDGISFQITQDVSVEGCTVHGCTRYGLHPGTGSARVAIRHCTLRDNDQGGFFLCWRVQEGLFEDIACERNGVFGISIGHKDTDNTFVRCTLRHNGRYGLVFRDEELYNGAHRNTWRECLVEDNGTETEGVAVYVQGHTHDSLFERCTFREMRTGNAGRRHIGLWLGSNARRFRTVNCTWSGFTQNVLDESGPEGTHQL